MDRHSTWGGEHTVPCTDDVLWNCAPETYIILLTRVTLINSIKGTKRKKCKGPRIARTILRKKKKFQNLPQGSNNQDSVGTAEDSADRWNSTASAGTNLPSRGKWFLTRMTRQSNRGRTVLLTNGAGTTRYSHSETMNLDPYFTPYTIKINSNGSKT